MSPLCTVVVGVFVDDRVSASRLRSCLSSGTDVVRGGIIARQWRDPAATRHSADLGTSYSDLAAAR